MILTTAIAPKTLTADELHKIDAYWRAGYGYKPYFVERDDPEILHQHQNRHLGSEIARR